MGFINFVFSALFVVNKAPKSMTAAGDRTPDREETP
jgi:hypothetical protein